MDLYSPREAWRGVVVCWTGGRGCASQVVLRGDDHAPPRPDEAGGGQGQVLGDGELLDGAGEVGDAGNDEGPLRPGVSPDTTSRGHVEYRFLCTNLHDRRPA